MNRIQGLLGIRSKMSNLNSDFNKMPRKTSEGEYFNTDKSIKFLYRNFFKIATNEQVLMRKTLKLATDKDKNELIIPRTLSERYESIFNSNPKTDSKKVVLENLFKCIDIRFFGATFAEAGISINGAIQFGMGFNVYDDVTLADITILSPFRNSSSSSEFSEQSTLGKMSVTEEAHYITPFNISPTQYNDLEEEGFISNSFVEEDYNKFKEASLSCANFYRSSSKNNIENELALFIEFSGNYVIHGLENKIIYNTTETGIEIDLTKLNDVLNNMESKIKNVELYINNDYITIVGTHNNINIKDITTGNNF